ncbi:Auxin-induced protein 22B [Hibiscus syriacus]|uniref:Auxin-responsive protein n=1 Tax=Hibiscus syriacus TaxID=106335 RepID=A0A6A2XTJ7_HIBSY|nr:auxin-induced protein 22D-like [Hibiscus syriacus]KAE8678972.1 Auxin-induced protein 22B [Hibiscus syriacus]
MALATEKYLNLEATELRLGLPGISDESAKNQTSTTPRINKRALSEQSMSGNIATDSKNCDQETAPHTKAQVVGWPPIRSYRKNSLQPKKSEAEISGIYVKVSMDGAPYLRKIDLKVFKGYPELLKALEDMFKFKAGEYSESEGYNGSEYVPTYEDKDGDWMLVGDVPWEMFTSCCKKLRIMKGSEARGLGCVV